MIVGDKSGPPRRGLGRIIRGFGIGCLLVAGVDAPTVVHGQATLIVADTLPARSTGTLVMPSGQVQVIGGGTVAGRNLFHSFSDFNLASGVTAQWVYLNPRGAPPLEGGAGIANVISRVTGGNTSFIAGTLKVNAAGGDPTAMPRANFYFVNPSGIVFNQYAQVDVPKAAHFSTASELRFGPGQVVFSAVDPQSTFSVADPVSFGFFGGESDLTIIGPGLKNNIEELSLSGANVALIQPALQAGAISLVAVGRQAIDVPIEGDLAAGPGPAGLLSFDGGYVATAPSSTASGNLLIAAGDVGIGKLSVLSSTTTGVADAGSIKITSGSLENGGVVMSDTYGSGDAGAIMIEAKMVTNFGQITSSSNLPATGAAGSVSISANVVTNRASIVSESFGTGDAGEVAITTTGSAPAGNAANCLTNCVINSGNIATTAHNTLLPSRAGNIVITTDTLTNLNTSTPTNLRKGGIRSNARGPGPPGKIMIFANAFDNDGTVQTTASTDPAFLGQAGGNPGDISIQGRETSGAKQIVFINRADGTINATTFDAIDAGTITVGATTITNLGEIGTDTYGSGSAGKVVLETSPAAGVIDQVTNMGAISSVARPSSSGNAGDIAISTRRLVNLAPGVISSSASGAGLDAGGKPAAESFGAPGTVTIKATLVDNGDADTAGGTIETNASGAGLNAVSGAKGNISIEGGEASGDEVPTVTNSGVISSNTSNPDELTVDMVGAGDIAIATTMLSNWGTISSDTFGGGNGGKVAIAAQSLQILRGGQVSSNATSSGNAGNVLLSGSIAGSRDPVTPDNYKTVAGRLAPVQTLLIDGAGSAISSTSHGVGKAGQIVAAADQIFVQNGGTITTDITTNSPAARGGDIYLLFPPDQVYPNGVLRLQGAAAQGSPQPSDIGVITTKAEVGSGGDIYIYRPNTLILDGGLIKATGTVANAQVFNDAGVVVSSSDRFNLIDVAGLYVLSGQVEDLSGAAAVQTPSFVDAEKVLAGQCRSQAVEGETSLLVNALKGPYGGLLSEHRAPASSLPSVPGSGCAGGPPPGPDHR